MARWELVQLSGPFLGTLPGWIAAISSMGIAGFVGVIGSIWLKSRRLGIDERKDKREGLGNLIDRLEADATKLKKINVMLYDRMRQCESHDAARKLQIGELNFVVRAMINKMQIVAPHSEELSYALKLMAAVYPAEADSDQPGDDDDLAALIGDIR